MSLLRLGSLLAVAVLLSACVENTQKPATHTATNQVSAATEPVAVERVLFDIPRGTKYITDLGDANSVSCAIVREDDSWDGGREFSDEPELIAKVEQILTEAKFDVASHSSSDLFGNSDSTSRATYRLGAIVKNIQLRTCHGRPFLDLTWDGTVYAEGSVTIEWQLFSNLSQSVVFTSSTTAPATSGPASSEGVYLAIVNGIGNAAAELTKDPDFVAALSLEAGATTAAVGTSDALAIKGPSRWSGSFSSNAERAQAATVLIVGRGHGSGFLISSDGYMLTNYHVVGDAAEVRVELGDGNALVGQVVRRDPHRDIALVKLPIDGAAALPLNLSTPAVGSDIYAIGAPLETALTDTVTRGIVSAIRDSGGLRFIQGDVDVQPGNSGGPLTDPSGNVVGVTQSGIEPNGTSVGINFFIPIADALAALNVTVN